MWAYVKVLEYLLSQIGNQSRTHHGNDQQRFLPSEWPADTAPHPVSERLPSIGWKVIESAIQHSTRFEFLGIITPNQWVAMKGVQNNHDRISLLDLVFSIKKLSVGFSTNGESRSGRLES
jgi:hypothetical protein